MDSLLVGILLWFVLPVLVVTAVVVGLEFGHKKTPRPAQPGEARFNLDEDLFLTSASQQTCGSPRSLDASDVAERQHPSESSGPLSAHELNNDGRS